MVTQGFILTRSQREVSGMAQLEYWLSTDHGPVKLLVPGQQAVFFILQQDITAVTQCLEDASVPHQIKAIALRTFEQQAVAAVYFVSNAYAFTARQALKSKKLVCFEDDVRLTERFLMERFIYGSASFQGERLVSSHRPVNKIYPTYKNAQLKSTEYLPALKVMSLDIECSEQGELYSIGLAAEGYQSVLMIGCGEACDWITWVENEKQLLLSFVQHVLEFDPDLLIGWNVINFDFRLLIKRAALHKVPLTLGRDGDAVYWRDAKGESNQGFASMAGRLVIDGIDALKTATYQFDSFSLEFVAQSLLGKGKKTENVDDRLAQITYDFVHNKRKLAEYNLQDCELVLEIFAYTRLLDFLILRSQLTGLELDRSGGSVAAFLNLYLPRVHRAGYVSPNRPENGGLASPGGYVMNSLPGLYTHVLVLDFKSLYPSIIRTFKIDPVGLAEGLKHPDDAIPGYKGGMFSRDVHFLPDIITTLWSQRDEAKRQQDAARSQAIKILMNSFYGVLGSGGCPFYDTRLASSITMRGHDIMQTTARWIEEAGYKVIYGDTDSTFVWLEGEMSNEKAQDIGQQLQKEINQKWNDNIHQEFQLENFLEIEFETHFSQFLMPTIRGSELGSKKRYAGLKQGKHGTELVFKGLETVRSDWTALAKRFQTSLYERVFAGQDIREYMLTLIADTRAGKFDKELVYRKRLRRRLDKYVKNVPPHVRAARLADENSRRLGKRSQYQNKGTIAYVITVNGPEPVEYQLSVLDYEHYIEKQIRPIAEGILPFIGLSFENMTSAQLGLF